MMVDGIQDDMSCLAHAPYHRQLDPLWSDNGAGFFVLLEELFDEGVKYRKGFGFPFTNEKSCFSNANFSL